MPRRYTIAPAIGIGRDRMADTATGVLPFRSFAAA